MLPKIVPVMEGVKFGYIWTFTCQDGHRVILGHALKFDWRIPLKRIDR